MMSSGGRDYSIINHDPRERNSNIISIFDKHTQEVCGLKWNNQTLASGANDNLVLLWDKKKMNVRSTCHGHTAAVKAMAWCPW
jgi:WD40 repeat protein